MTRPSWQRHSFSSENWTEQACTYVVLIVDDSRFNDCDYLLRTYTTCRRLWGLTEVHSLMAETVVGFALLRIMRGSKGLFAVEGLYNARYNIQIGNRCYM